MLTWDISITFFISAVILALAPGPDNIFVLTQSALYGVRAGFTTIAGIVLGLLGHTLAVSLGIAALLKAYPAAFMLVKIIGAVYLLYLAWLSFKCSGTSANLEKKPFIGYKKIFVRGAMMSSTNPKVTMFFLALLPQFASPERGSVGVQIFCLGLLFMLSAVLVFGIIAILGGKLATVFNKYPHYQTIIHKIAALIFVAMAIFLLFG